VLHVPGYYRLWPGFPTCSATREFGNSLVARQNHLDGPTTPITQRLPAWHVIGLGSNPFRSPLLGVSRLLSLPPGTEMFQFPGFPVPALCVQTGLTGHDPSRVSPFGDPRIDGWLTPPLGLSQSPTSFIGSRCQGIRRVHFLTCRRDARARYGVLKEQPDQAKPGLPARVRRVVPDSDDRRLKEQRSLRAAQGAHWRGGILQPGHVPGPSTSSEDVVDGGTPRAEIQRTHAMNSQWFTELEQRMHTYGTCRCVLRDSRKEVIQPHLPVRLPCYDFVPIADPTFDGSLPDGLGHRLRVLPTFMT
jgi:hypothetical protein